MMAQRSAAHPGAHAPPPVTVYWRPGCPYCVRLRWGLDRRGIASEELNIWSDPSAAAFVRSVNGGNETVPTVVIGMTSLSNPTPREVQREVLRQSTCDTAS